MASLRSYNSNVRNQRLVLEKQCMENEKREATLRQLQNDKYMMSALQGEERVENLRQIRQLSTIQQEVQKQERLLRETEQRRLCEEQRGLEERLAAELERVRVEQERDARLRQKVRAEAPELRDLERKLREAYANRERAAQIAEREAHKFDGIIKEAELIKFMQDENARARAAEKKREEDRQRLRTQYQGELEGQMLEQERKRQEAYEEFLKEKLMVDEIVRKIYEEDARDRERELEKRRATREFIDQFKRERHDWQVAEKKRLEDENRRILEFMKMQQVRVEEQIKLKAEREHAKAKVQERIAKDIEERDRAREELEAIRQELYLEEEQARIRRAEINELEQRIRQRIELANDYEKQIELKRERLDRERADEDKFKQAMLAKFAEDDRIDQLTQEKRRIKQAEHRRAVEELLRERRAKADAERRMLEDELARERERERDRLRLIEEERQRLLKEHATKLIGYLPRGVLRDESDLAMLGDDFKQRYAKRTPIDELDEQAFGIEVKPQSNAKSQAIRQVQQLARK